MDWVLDQSYNYYSTNITHHPWTKEDRKDCYDWFHKTLDFSNGQYDPRKLNVIAAEPKFDIELKHPWAK